MIKKGDYNALYNFNNASKKLNDYSSNLDIPKDVNEIALGIYKKALKQKLIKGRTIEVVTAASLYIACRNSKVPRTLDEIAKSSKLTKKEIGRTYRFLAKKLNIKLHLTSLLEFMPRFSHKLKLSDKTHLMITEILEKAIDNGLTPGRDPISLIAGVTYIVFDNLGQKKTQEEIGELFGVSTVTIRTRCKEIKEKLDLDSFKKNDIEVPLVPFNKNKDLKK